MDKVKGVIDDVLDVDPYKKTAPSDDPDRPPSPERVQGAGEHYENELAPVSRGRMDSGAALIEPKRRTKFPGRSNLQSIPSVPDGVWDPNEPLPADDRGRLNSGAAFLPGELRSRYRPGDSTVVIDGYGVPKKEPSIGPEPLQSAEDILILLENPGRFQMIQYILMCLMYWTLSWNDALPMFYSIQPTVTCHHPEIGNVTVENKTFNFNTTGDYCYCHTGGVDYHYPGKEWSIVADMNLICERAYLVTIPTTLYFIGNLIAGPLSGTFADKLGRRTGVLFFNVFYTVFSLGSIFSRDMVSFTILRFLIGIGRQGIHSVGFVLMLEWMSPMRRGPGCALAVASMTLGALMLSWIAYLIQNWVYLQIVVTFINFWFVGLIWFGPESLKWLLLTNKPEQAKEVVRKVAKFNRVTLPENVYSSLDDIARKLQIRKNDGRPYTPSDWFSTPAIRHYTVLSCWIWFAGFIVWLCFSVLVPAITGSLYANVAIGAALELVARLVVVYIAYRCGNRLPLMSYFLVGAVFALLAGMIPGSTIHEQKAKASMLVLGRIAIAMCSSVNFLYVQELFPTIVRNSAFGLCSIAMRIGDILGSYLLLLGAVKTCQVDGVSSSGLSLEIMGLIALTGTAATFFLPETRGKKMPETVQATEYRRAKIEETRDQYDEAVSKIE